MEDNFDEIKMFINANRKSIPLIIFDNYRKSLHHEYIEYICAEDSNVDDKEKIKIIVNLNDSNVDFLTDTSDNGLIDHIVVLPVNIQIYLDIFKMMKLLQ